ncbi:MAG TPA: hypothetical protein PKI11_08825 [Candidatus Hydrogenedentes bacterium]|nr:hypothetical protein [Candidatus Hydrogenedentota bacterium]
MKTQTLFDLATDALREAVREVVEEHVREGRPIAIWRDGRAIWVDPRTAQEVVRPARVAEASTTYEAQAIEGVTRDSAPKGPRPDAHEAAPKGPQEDSPGQRPGKKSNSD